MSGIESAIAVFQVRLQGVRTVVHSGAHSKHACMRAYEQAARAHRYMDVTRSTASPTRQSAVSSGVPGATYNCGR